jgi:hypothetical protein
VTGLRRFIFGPRPRRGERTEHQKRDAIRRRNRGEDSNVDIGRSYNVSGWTPIARMK